MKKLLFLTLLPLISISQDKIKLIDGRILETKILEVNTKEVKYKMFNYLDGPTHVTPKKEISEIEYQNGDKANFNPTDKEIESKKVKFTRYAEASALAGVGHYYNDAFGMGVSPGAMFNNRLYLGFGTGVYYTLLMDNYYVNANDFTNTEEIILPLYLNTKFYFTKKKFSPFINLSGGINTAFSSDISYTQPFGEAGIGFNYQQKKNLGVYLIAGWNVYQHKYNRVTSYSDFHEKTEPLSAISVRIGFKF